MWSYVVMNEGVPNVLDTNECWIVVKCKEACYAWIVLWFNSFSCLNVDEWFLSSVTSMEYSIWVELLDATCTLNKHDLELS